MCPYNAIDTQATCEYNAIVKRSTNWAMILVLLLAAVCRLWMLPGLPLGLHYDEAANVILTRQIAEEGYRPLFIRAYTGKEVLFFYASAPWLKITGGQAWGLRLSAGMLGILTVAATYAMVRALLGSKRKSSIPLYAAAWMAVILPHVVLSRYGFRAITQPLMQALTVTAIWRGLRGRRTGWLIAGGLLLGLTGYTYLAARLFPIPLAIALGVLWWQTPKHNRIPTRYAFAVIALCALISFAPLGIFFLQNPETFSTRISQVAAPSLSEALRGAWLCLKALILPGEGDPYVRFNPPGRPVLNGLSALLACVGLVVFARTRYHNGLSRAGRVLVLSSIAVMVLPSALATAEITPSHLRMVGVFPFLTLLPALGLDWITHHLAGKRTPAITATTLFPTTLIAILGVVTGVTYAGWSQSTALFYAADGEMVLAAQAVREEAGEGTTIIISSEHYRHPTLAVLSPYYSQIKWNTAGASFVLPATGDAVTIVPRSMQPPSPWPQVITQLTGERTLDAPDGSHAISIQRWEAADIAVLRQPGSLRPAVEPVADFAHVVGVHSLTPMHRCEAGSPCTILLTWEVLAPYPALLPQVRVVHPITGQWSRATPFHYPAEQWTPGDLILDQIQLDLPAGMPPGDGYMLSVSMVDTRNQNPLPRLVREEFAGLEYRVPTAGTLPWPDPPHDRLTQVEIDQACAGMSQEQPIELDGLRLQGWILPTKSPDVNAQVKAGELLLVTLCWEVLGDASVYQNVELVLGSGDDAFALYTGQPAGGYGFAEWIPGTVVEDRYAVRLPRDITAGSQSLGLHIDTDDSINLAQFEVVQIDRTFNLPEVDSPVDARFDSVIRLRGYDLAMQTTDKAVDITLYWQSIQSIEQDFVVFVHLLDPTNGDVVSQVDEQPQQGEHPTSSWIEGEVIADTHTLALPPEFEEGSIVLRVGLYIPSTGTYLMVDGARELLLETELPSDM